MQQSLHILLAGLIDYAGLFPPAALEMGAAVANFARYRGGRNSWMLGRFVLPLSRLGEFERAAALKADAELPWRLSVLAGADLDAEVETIARFNERFDQRILIDTVEMKAGDPAEIAPAVEALHSDLTAYFEIPIGGDPAPLISAIGEHSARAKVRTGSTVAEGFPSAADLARFIRTCADEDVPFKATAGLHHPLRSVNKLTYEPDSPEAMMHGFLNLFIAAAFAQCGMPAERLAELLEEKSPGAFRFENDCIFWNGEMVVKGHLRNTRNLFAISFGSCSFEEPLDDLRKTGLLQVDYAD